MSLRDEVAKRVQLNRNGFGRCCFHQDRSASLHVFLATKGKHKGEWLFNCFGCGEHGDLRDWLRIVEGKTEDELPAIVERSPSERLQEEREAARELEWQELLDRYPTLPDEARMFIVPDLGARLRRRLQLAGGTHSEPI